MNLLQAAKQALEAFNWHEWMPERKAAMDNLRAVIEEVEKQEPVAWTVQGELDYINQKNSSGSMWKKHCAAFVEIPLYTHPAPIPEGWQLVPVEPTEKMLGADGPKHKLLAKAIYRVMLQDAPK